MSPSLAFHSLDLAFCWRQPARPRFHSSQPNTSVCLMSRRFWVNRGTCIRPALNGAASSASVKAESGGSESSGGGTKQMTRIFKFALVGERKQSKPPGWPVLDSCCSVLLLLPLLCCPLIGAVLRCAARWNAARPPIWRDPRAQLSQRKKSATFFVVSLCLRCRTTGPPAGWPACALCCGLSAWEARVQWPRAKGADTAHTH